MTLYEELKEAGVEIDNYRSDLYVPYCDKAVEIIQKHKQGDSTIKASMFFSEKDGRTWIELPFQYTPFWDKPTSIPGLL